MANRLFKVVGLAVLIVFPAHSQNLSVLDQAVAITTSLQFITEDDVDQRTRLDLLLAQKQASREVVIGDLGVDMDRIARAESAGFFGPVEEPLHPVAIAGEIWAEADRIAAIAFGGMLAHAPLLHSKLSDPAGLIGVRPSATMLARPASALTS